VHTTRFWNNINQVRSMVTSKPQGLKRAAKTAKATYVCGRRTK